MTLTGQFHERTPTNRKSSVETRNVISADLTDWELFDWTSGTDRNLKYEYIYFTKYLAKYEMFKNLLQYHPVYIS